MRLDGGDGKQPKRTDDPRYTPVLTDREIIAIRSLHQGIADQGQQVLALDAIVQKICRRYLDPFRSEFADTAFLLGRQHAGDEIIRAIKTPIGKRQEERHGSSKQPESPSFTAATGGSTHRGPYPPAPE